MNDVVDNAGLRHVLMRAAHDSPESRRFLEEEAGELPMGDALVERHEEEQVSRPGQFFVDLLFTLTHYEFPAERAEAVWHEILRHRDSLSAAVGRNVGVLVAALDYLTNVTHEVDHPVVAPESLLLGAARAATRDELTGLLDRATARTVLDRELRRTERYGQPLSLALIDIDHFKRINDSLGHNEGDRVLASVAHIIQAESRALDVVARYGGEEFLVIAPGIDVDEGRRMAERLRARVQDELAGAGVTISVGVVTARALCGIEELIGCADAVMYTAKRAGRNRTASAGALPA